MTPKSCELDPILRLPVWGRSTRHDQAGSEPLQQTCQGVQAREWSLDREGKERIGVKCQGQGPAHRKELIKC